MLRVIVVVARDRPELFGYFEKTFAGMPDIKVLLDRRLAPAERGTGRHGRPRSARASRYLRRAAAAGLRHDSPVVMARTPRD